MQSSLDMKNNQIRATGASCKECRRLKIKCDKQVPCGTCTKRGLQSLCPDGQLSGAKGSRYVLATAEESWHRIQALCVRVQDLEFALERAQSHITSEKHPLLDEELVKIGQDPRAVIKTEPGKPQVVPPEDVPIANLGTMKISKSGSYRWLGTTALPAIILDDNDEDDAGHSEHVSDSTLAAHERTSSLPGGQHSVPLHDLKVSALQQLPPRQRALQLIENYFETYSQWVTIVDRPIVMDSLFSTIYDGDAMSLSAYNISSFFSILALGGAIDLPVESACQEFRARRKLAKSLFFAEWPKGPSAVDELETLLLLYRVSWPLLESNHSDIYELLAWGIKLAEKIGLHRDPEPLNLSPEECLRRRRVFWALWYYDTLASLYLGQPPTLARGFVDCKPPQFTYTGEVDLHPRLTLVFHDILSHFLEAKTAPHYAAVLRIDQKIREIELDTRQVNAAGGSPVPSRTRDAIAPYINSLKCFMLMSLHRTYFSYAVTRPNEDPISGRFGTSTHAMFEAASTHIERLLSSGRFTYWQHGFSQIWMQYHNAMLFLYAFPTYLPYWPRSEEAMKLADTALKTLFYPNAAESELISNSLPSLLNAQQKAQEALAKYQKGQWSHPTLSQLSDKDAQDVLLNDKFIIYSSPLYDTSRGSSPSDHHVPSYPESISSSSAYRNNWVGHDSPMVVSSETYGHFSQGTSHILSHQQSEGHFNESTHYTSTSMDWTQHGRPSIPKVESPPHSAGLYPSHTLFSPQHHSAQTGLQIPGEVIGVADHRHPTIRRARGLSRAHSFPSDLPTGYSSAGAVQTHAFQSMQAPSHVPSPTTPVGPGSMHSVDHSVHEPYGRWIHSTIHSQDPYRPTHSHGYVPPSSNLPPQHNLSDPTAVPMHVLDQPWNNINVQRG